jgi:hypothetical protein
MGNMAETDINLPDPTPPVCKQTALCLQSVALTTLWVLPLAPLLIHMGTNYVVRWVRA